MNLIKQVPIPKIDAKAIQRFWSKIDKNGPLWCGTNCWIWKAGKSWFGYGQFWLRFRNFSAQRIAYKILKGDIRPQHYVLDHLCMNKLCVNPEHLEPVPPSINSSRGAYTQPHYRRANCKHGHALSEENRYYRPDRPGHSECKTCWLARAKANRKCNHTRLNRSY